jgi:hypothetical protein
MRAFVPPICRFCPAPAHCCVVAVSANARDFASLHREWLEGGRSHFGILIIPQQRYSTGEIVRRILRLNSSGFDLAGGIYYLSNF